MGKKRILSVYFIFFAILNINLSVASAIDLSGLDLGEEVRLEPKGSVFINELTLKYMGKSIYGKKQRKAYNIGGIANYGDQRYPFSGTVVARESNNDLVVLSTGSDGVALTTIILHGPLFEFRGYRASVIPEVWVSSKTLKCNSKIALTISVSKNKQGESIASLRYNVPNEIINKAWRSYTTANCWGKAGKQWTGATAEKSLYLVK